MLGYYLSIPNIPSCTKPKVCQMRANKYEKINELMSDIKMSSANAFVSDAINSAFIPWLVPLNYIVDFKEKYIHMGEVYQLEGVK